MTAVACVFLLFLLLLLLLLFLVLLKQSEVITVNSKVNKQTDERWSGEPKVAAEKKPKQVQEMPIMRDNSNNNNNNNCYSSSRTGNNITSRWWHEEMRSWAKQSKAKRRWSQRRRRRLRQHVENQFNAVQSKVEIEDGAGSKVESAESATANINK